MPVREFMQDSRWNELGHGSDQIENSPFWNPDDAESVDYPEKPSGRRYRRAKRSTERAHGLLEDVNNRLANGGLFGRAVLALCNSRFRGEGGYLDAIEQEAARRRDHFQRVMAGR